jgi:hypothetical protein
MDPDSAQGEAVVGTTAPSLWYSYPFLTAVHGQIRYMDRAAARTSLIQEVLGTLVFLSAFSVAVHI